MDIEKSDLEDQANCNNSHKAFMLAYSVKECEASGLGIWSKVGVAWSHLDGQGVELRLEALPLDGRIVLRCIAEGEEDLTGEFYRELPP